MNDNAHVSAIDEGPLNAALVEYFERIDRGESIELAALIAAHPDCEMGLRQFLSEERKLSVVDAHPLISTYENQAGRTLGDFRLIRELGHGGMGVVYEAEQLSLGRRIALKVLPFAAMLDKQQLARFKNEACAAATLEHPNIVAVYSVGSEGSIHYYAMQLISGESLAQVVATLRHAKWPSEPSLEKSHGNAVLSTDAAQISTEFRQSELPSATVLPQSAVDTGPAADSSTLGAPCAALPPYGCREFYRAVARLGIQAAEALDHAHQNGILHRDVKPGNLMLDASGKLYVTDFGLARIEADAGMTITGEVLGTLRYTSPEQALTKRAVVDHRSDIYSLGATLYELLTLRPPFDDADRAELLKKIAFDEPRPSRQIERRIAVDLDTIVLKAMAKSIADRYATAQYLADDLQRFLDDRPIQAKRPNVLAIARKWSRRHRPMLWAAMITLVVSGLVVAGSVGWAIRDKQARTAIVDAMAINALDEAAKLMDNEKWTEAKTAANRAHAVLTANGNNGLITQRATEILKDLQMVERIDGLRHTIYSKHELWREKYNGAERGYSQAFRNYGIDVDSLDVETAADQIRACAIRLELAAALDAWADVRRSNPVPKLAKPLLQVARLVDPDSWRNRIRDAMEENKNQRKSAFAALVASADGQSLPLQTTITLCVRFMRYDCLPEAIKLLRAAQRQYPDDFRVNYQLGLALRQDKPPQTDEAIRFLTVAAAIRPDTRGGAG